MPAASGSLTQDPCHKSHSLKYKSTLLASLLLLEYVKHLEMKMDFLRL